MDAVRNPYNPGAGRRPPALVGREFQLDAFRVLVHRASLARTSQSMVLSGLRGVGKTVLLNELAAQAQRAGWITAKLEAAAEGGTQEQFTIRMVRSLHASLRERQHKGWGGKFRTALGSFKAFSLTVDGTGSLTFGIDVDAQHGRADTGVLETDLVELAIDLTEAAVEQRVGVAVFVDELQDVHHDILAAVITAVHDAGQRELPFYLIGAGLPSLPRILAEAKSYAERLFDFHTISYLSPDSAAQALTAPAHAEGVHWDDDALTEINQAAGGYPYFLQEYGAAAWNVAVGPAITGRDAVVARQLGEAKLDAGFYASRWDRATAAERDYLRAMAADGGRPSLSGTVAARLGRHPRALGPARAALIGKGLLWAPEHGQIAYTVPGMAQYIDRQIVT